MIEIDGIIWRQSPIGDWWETIGGDFKVPGVLIAAVLGKDLEDVLRDEQKHALGRKK